MDLSLILPVHNEAEGIARNLPDFKTVLERLKITYEIICVENGSTDDTYKILETLSRKNKNVIVIPVIRRLGNAVRAGIAKAKGDAICYMVSDGQIEPKYIIDLYTLYKQHRQKYALYKIWRTTRENPTRLTNSRLYNMLARLFLGIDSNDINATPKLISASLLRTLPLISDNIALDLELLLGLKKRGKEWLEIPAQSKKRDSGTSTTKLKSVWEMIRWMVRFRLG